MQDKEKGGISDRPNDAVDVFHTYFGVAGMFSFSFKAKSVSGMQQLDFLSSNFLSVSLFNSCLGEKASCSLYVGILLSADVVN